jgi:hypothetical protein
MKHLLSISVALAMLCSAGFSSAGLGDTKAAAEKKEKRLEKKHGVSDPFYQTNAKGRIIQECWQTPPDGWGVSNALKFARGLIPAKLRKGKAKREKVGGNQIFFKYKNGATIVLSEGPNGIIQVEVHAPGYKGQRC